VSNSNETKLKFADAFNKVANHLFGDDLGKHMPENLISLWDAKFDLDPDEFRKKAEENHVAYSLAQKRHRTIVQKILCEKDAAKLNKLKSGQTQLQDTIQALYPGLKSGPELEDYEKCFLGKKSIQSVLERIYTAMRNEKIKCHLGEEGLLDVEHLTDAKNGEFVPAESVGEFQINGLQKRGIVWFSKREFETWLKTEPPISGIPQNKTQIIAKTKERLRELYRDPETKSFRQDALYEILEKEISGLVRSSEFDVARKEVANDPEFAWITKPGRHPNSPK
jgi:hypothetical protein